MVSQRESGTSQSYAHRGACHVPLGNPWNYDPFGPGGQFALLPFAEHAPRKIEEEAVNDNDTAMRAHAATNPVPEFDDPAFVKPRPLSEATVAIVTSAALHTAGDTGWGPNADPQFKVLDSADRSLQLAHFSPNFDRVGYAADINVVYPIDRLNELAADGTIGAVAPHHYAFAGNQDETVSGIRLDTGPRAAKLMAEDGVDIVLLTPV